MHIDKCHHEEKRPDDWMPELHDIPISVVNAFLYPPPLSADNMTTRNGIMHDEYKDSSEEGSLTIRRRKMGKRNLL